MKTTVALLTSQYLTYEGYYELVKNPKLLPLDKCVLFDKCEAVYQTFKKTSQGLFAKLSPRASAHETLSRIRINFKALHRLHKDKRQIYLTNWHTPTRHDPTNLNWLLWVEKHLLNTKLSYKKQIRILERENPSEERDRQIKILKFRCSYLGLVNF